MRLWSAAIALAGLAVAPAGQERLQFRSSVDVIHVYATVRGRSGAPVLDLDRDDFDVRVDGKPREIVVFSKAVQSISVAMVLDGSGSIRFDDRKQIARAAQAFVGYLLDRDRMSIDTLHWKCQSLTADRIALATAAGMLPFLADPGSPIWGAVGRAIDALASEPVRRAILLFSDGQDTGPAGASLAKPPSSAGLTRGCNWAPPNRSVSVADVRRATERESVMVYAVTTDSPGPQQDQGLRQLANITFETGGALYRLGSLAKVRVAFSQIAEELHTQYSLGFVQTESDGRRHDIRVRVNRPGVRVRARQSFIAASSRGSTR